MGSGFSRPFRYGKRSRKPKYRKVGVQTDPIRRSVGVGTDFPDDEEHDYNVHANPNHTTGTTRCFSTQANLSDGEHHDPLPHPHDHHDPEPSIPRSFSSDKKGKGKATHQTASESSHDCPIYDSDRSGPSCYRPPQKHYFQTTRPQPQENPTPPYYNQHPHYFYQDPRGVKDECRRFDEMPHGNYNYNYDPTPRTEWHGHGHGHRHGHGHGQPSRTNYYGGYYDIHHQDSAFRPLDNPWSYEPQGHNQHVELSSGEKFARDAVAQLFGGVNPYYYGERY